MTDGVLVVSVLMVDTTLVGTGQTHVSYMYIFIYSDLIYLLYKCHTNLSVHALG